MITKFLFNHKLLFKILLISPSDTECGKSFLLMNCFQIVVWVFILVFLIKSVKFIIQRKTKQDLIKMLSLVLKTS